MTKKVKNKSKWPKKIVIIRHGESELNVALDSLQEDLDKEVMEKLSNIRDADILLTKKGKWQSKQTGLFLKKNKEKFDVCFCSPYKRTIQTANEIISTFVPNLQILPDIRLREKEFGRLHCITKKTIKEKFPEEHRALKLEGQFYYRLLGGENYPDVAMRAHNFIDKLFRDYGGKNVLIITHQVPYKMFRFWFEHLNEEQTLGLESVPNCGIQIYEIDFSKKIEGRMKLKAFNKIGYDLKKFK